MLLDETRAISEKGRLDDHQPSLLIGQVKSANPSQACEHRQCARHREVVGRLVERFGMAAHHEAVKHARKNMHIDVWHVRSHGSIGSEYFGGRGVVLIAPDHADWRRHAVEFSNEIEHSRAVA